MMLALLIMGVSNVWSATQHFNVVYSGRSVAQGAGYEADSRTITYSDWFNTRNAGTIQNVTPNGFDVVGDYANGTVWPSNELGYLNEIPSHITPTHIDGYSASVSASGTTVTITYTITSVRYRVIYEDELLPGAGYTITNRTVTNGSITSNDNDYILVLTGDGEAVPSGITADNIGTYIQANSVSGYTPSVSLVTSEAQMGYAGNIYINYITNTTPSVEEDNDWYYSNVYERDTHTKILLPSGECAISLKNTSLVTANIPLTSPSGKTVVAIQKFGLTYAASVYKPKVYNCSRVNNNYYDTPDNRNSHYYSDATSQHTYITGESLWGYDHRNENLVTVNFPSGSQVRSIGDYAFVCCLKLESVNNIPSILEYLGTGAFAVGEKLTKVDFPSSAKVKAIKNATFWACSAIKRLYLPEGVIEIEGQSQSAALQWMTSIEEIHLPNTLKYIGPHFMCSAKALKTLTIPVSVEYIDGACFHGCESLTTCYILGPAAVLQNADGESGTFLENHTLCADPVNNCTFYTTNDNLSGYQNDPVWSKIDNEGNWSLRSNPPEYANYLKAIPEEKRTLPTKWVTAVFPKEVERSKFGDNTLLARMNDCDGYTTQNVDGKVYRVYHLNFTEIEGDNIPANVPLLIKAGQETDYTFYNAADQEEDWFKQHSTDPLTVPVICYQDGAEITMKGVYLEHNIQPGEFYFKNNNADFTTDEDGKTVEHPKFLIAPETGYVTIDPCRCWWTIEQDKHIPGNSTIAPAKKSRFFGETTGIEEIETRIVIDAIYDLNGHKMDVKSEDLPQGLFIINGKKVLKK